MTKRSDHPTENVRIHFGKHKGELYTRLPVSYLKWMVNIRHQQSGIAQAELDRRGTVTPELDVSGHAIDRASQRLLEYWKASRVDEEGLHAWLCRMAAMALRLGKRDGDRRIYLGIAYVFEVGGCWPVLKSVHPVKRGK